MGLNGVDDGTGISFKRRPNTKKSEKIKKDDNGLDSKISKPLLKTKNNLVEDLQDMYVRGNTEYVALINGVMTEYDFATDTDVNDTKLSATLLGIGYVVETVIGSKQYNSDSTDSTKLLYFWKKITETEVEKPIESESKLLSDGDSELTDYHYTGSTEYIDLKKDITNVRDDELDCGDGFICQDGLILSLAPMKMVNGLIMAGPTDPTNIVKQNEKDLTMNTNTQFTKANELLEDVKRSGDKGVDMLIDYCRISFAEVFTKTTNGADADKVTTDLQEQMAYIITEINSNDLLTPEAKAKLVEAIDSESKEYQKLFETLCDVNDDTKELLNKKEASDTNWGKTTIYIVGAIIALGAAYSLYRYLEPEDVIIDMSTMSIMNR